MNTRSNCLVLLVTGLISRKEERDEVIEGLIRSFSQLGDQERERLSTYLLESGTPGQQAAFAALMNPSGSPPETVAEFAS